MELQTRSNAEIYIEKYKELEEVVRATYGLSSNDSISYYLTQQEKYKNDKDEIAYCQQIRNLIQHKKKISNVYPIEPTNETIKYISLLIDRVKNKKKCCDICVKYNEIYQQPLDGKVKNAMSVMRDKTFTCVPIIEGKKVIGVFDENALFEYIAAEEIVEIDENLTFRDIESYLSIDKREMEEFLFLIVFLIQRINYPIHLPHRLLHQNHIHILPY